jgi:hypothetical protein
MTGSSTQRLVLASILLFTVVLGTRGITDDASVMLGNDMARYVMDGVFLHDLIGTGGVSNFQDLQAYAERYYAKYPALSLGHHPPLPFVALLPFFAVFGISLLAVRLAALTFFLFAAWGLFALARRLSGWQAASWATLLFVTNEYVLRAGQYLLSEMPMVAFVLASLNALLLYCDTRKTKYFVWFVICAATSLYAKQLAIFMFPVYGVILLTQLGWRSLFRRHVIVMILAGAALVAPLAAMTLALSPDNVRVVKTAATLMVTGARRVTALSILTIIVRTHLSWPIALLVLGGTINLLWRREWRTLVVCVAWALAVIGGALVFAGEVEPARYSFGVMPAYFLLAAGLAVGTRSTTARRVMVLVLSASVLGQAWTIRNVRPSGAGGYETAAQYVVDRSREPAILFDSSVDTGYFVFFVRKHDPTGRLIVLRADKLLMPPSAGPSASTNPTGDVTAIYSALRRFGIRLIVVEEPRSKGPQILRQLHEELKTDRFIERERIPIVSREQEARGVDLVVYEFKDAQAADLDAELDIGLPLGRREIKLRLRDVIGTGRK